MSSHIFIFWGFITSLLDDIHVILGHIPYSPRSSEICLFVHTVIIERMSLVMTFLGFHHFLIDATLGHIPYFSRSFGGGRFFQTVFIEDMSHCYDIFGLHHVFVGCHTRAYPLLLRLYYLQFRSSDFIFCISGVQTCHSYESDAQTSSVSHFLAPQLDVQTSSSAYRAFRLHLHMDKLFKIHLYHIC